MGFYQNTCKPEGLGGKLMTQLMNGGHHAKLAVRHREVYRAERNVRGYRCGRRSGC